MDQKPVLILLILAMLSGCAVVDVYPKLKAGYRPPEGYRIEIAEVRDRALEPSASAVQSIRSTIESVLRDRGRLWSPGSDGPKLKLSVDVFEVVGPGVIAMLIHPIPVADVSIRGTLFEEDRPVGVADVEINALSIWPTGFVINPLVRRWVVARMFQKLGLNSERSVGTGG